MEFTRESEERISKLLMDDGITARPGISPEELEDLRNINRHSLDHYESVRYNLTRAEGKCGEDSSVGLSARLPKDAAIRSALLEELRGRFGDGRVAVCGDVVVIVSKTEKLEYDWQDAPTCELTLAAEKDLVFFDVSTRFDYSGLKRGEEKLARFVLSRPTQVRRRGEDGFSASRKTSVGEFFVYCRDVIEDPKIRFDKFVPSGA